MGEISRFTEKQTPRPNGLARPDAAYSRPQAARCCNRFRRPRNRVSEVTEDKFGYCEREPAVVLAPAQDAQADPIGELGLG